MSNMNTKNSQKEARKLAFFLPNTFTALNMACGFTCVVFAMKGEFYQACMILLLGAIFDSVDGRIARLTGTQSAFGEQFDSISDVISFGFAPAMLVYHRFLFDMGRIGLVVSFIYLLCGALRLARFNANIDTVTSDFFQGLPIPGAAWAVGGYVLLSTEVKAIENYPILTIVYVLFYAMLMISNIPFSSFKNSEWVRVHKKSVLFIIFITASLILVYEEIMVVSVITAYVFGSIVYFLSHKGEMKDVFEWKSEREHD